MNKLGNRSINERNCFTDIRRNDKYAYTHQQQIYYNQLIISRQNERLWLTNQRKTDTYVQYDCSCSDNRYSRINRTATSVLAVNVPCTSTTFVS